MNIDTAKVSPPTEQREIEGIIAYAKALDNRLRALNDKLYHTRDRVFGASPVEVSGESETPAPNGETQQLRDVLHFIERALDTLDDLAGSFERL